MAPAVCGCGGRSSPYLQQRRGLSGILLPSPGDAGPQGRLGAQHACGLQAAQSRRGEHRVALGTHLSPRPSGPPPVLTVGLSGLKAFVPENEHKCTHKNISAVHMVLEKEEGKKKNTCWFFPEGRWQSDASGLGLGPNGAHTRDLGALSACATRLGMLLCECAPHSTAVPRTDMPAFPPSAQWVGQRSAATPGLGPVRKVAPAPGGRHRASSTIPVTKGFHLSWAEKKAYLPFGYQQHIFMPGQSPLRQSHSQEPRAVCAAVLQSRSNCLGTQRQGNPFSPSPDPCQCLQLLLLPQGRHPTGALCYSIPMDTYFLGASLQRQHPLGPWAAWEPLRKASSLEEQ